ncbi:hypothetical protein, partial [Pseudomonas sp. PS01298]|uniref:hypothetical protein n=1 Tax=Pseudomonas sp. PS01298 TaxID=2991434 RepID=UPI00249A4E7F
AAAPISTPFKHQVYRGAWFWGCCAAQRGASPLATKNPVHYKKIQLNIKKASSLQRKPAHYKRSQLATKKASSPQTNPPIKPNRFKTSFPAKQKNTNSGELFRVPLYLK